MAANRCELSAREFNSNLTVGLVFAPAERDVYSYQRISNALAPLGAKPGRRTNGKEKPVYKHFAPPGVESDSSTDHNFFLIHQHARVYRLTGTRDHMKVPGQALSL